MRHTRSLTIMVTLTLTLTSCSLMGGGDDEPTSSQGSITPPATQAPSRDDEGTSSGPAAVPPPEASDPGSVTLLTHDSFNLPEELVTAFEEQSGYQLELQSGGDAGELTNQLVLTKGSPVADVVFGIDTTFASRAVSEGVLAAHTPADLPSSAEEHLLEGGETVLTPVDHGDVCVNVDDVWFANRGIAPPESLEDLTEPEYEDLFVTPGATTSSPGMAFLLATVGYFGQGEWQAYWQDLMEVPQK